ncbi:uncharacterized protein LOC142169035 [Nicotiana tabacum]|uniref:Uncharacterized protein LOC142169035 n=1 Tax=Nicotiana tabacum TaxID=4097 RepID=A0AC58SMX1_TOBAC
MAPYERSYMGGGVVLRLTGLSLEKLHPTLSRYKSFADKKVHDVALMENEKVPLRVSPIKGVIRLGKKDKLSPRFSGPFDVLDKVRMVAYKLVLPPSLLGIYSALHVSMPQKYHKDKSHVLEFSTMQLDKNLAYEEEPMAILDRQAWKVRYKAIASVKVLWRGQPREEATWETGSDIRADIHVISVV